MSLLDAAGPAFALLKRPARPRVLGLGLLAFLFLCLALRAELPWLVAYPADWIAPTAKAINGLLALLLPLAAPLCAAVAAVFSALLDGFGAALQWLPWPAALAFAALLAWRAGGPRLALFTVAALGYIVAAGYWREGMNTLAMVLLAMPVAVVAGFAVGVLAHRLRATRRPIEVALDLMQTVPAFAYLIPLLLLFGFGPVGGLVAAIVYAVPPMVRCTLLGLAEVPPAVLEAGVMAGCTGRQRFLHVELPTARPHILIGINQTTMACLSMVIMAAIIGGFQDIGWEILSAMRKAEFGQSLLSGLVIALLAMVIDRITLGLAKPRRPQRRLRTARFLALLALPLAAAALLHLAAPEAAARLNAQASLLDPGAINRALLEIVRAQAPLLDAIKTTVLYAIVLPLRLGLAGAVTPFTWGFALTPPLVAGYALAAALIAGWLAARQRRRAALAVVLAATLLYFGFTGLPWPAFAALVAALGWSVGGGRLLALALAAALFIVSAGLYQPLMQSLYLCGVAVFVCLLFGGGLGVLAARSDWVSRLLRPVCDTLQTMPQFVFLIPALMFFQVGEFTGLIAIVLYSIVPTIRYVEHGLRGVPRELTEVGRQVGCSGLQRLLHVELPVAAPQVALGVNQTLMAALSMLSVAAMVGTSDLGQQVYMALSKADAGQGLVAGTAIALVAIVADRTIRAAVHKRH